MASTSSSRRTLVLIAAAAALVAALPARAHPQGQRPVALIRPTATEVRVVWIAAADDVVILANHLRLPPAARPSEYPGDPAFRDYFAKRVTVVSGGRACAQEIARVAPAGPGSAVEMLFRCGAPLGSTTITITLLQDVSKKYATLGDARTPSGTKRGLFSATQPTVRIDLAGSDVFAAPTASPEGLPQRGRSASIIAMLQGESGSAGLAVALGVAFLLGALHALTPGHGKTITAAYLVGAGGNYRAALTLGGVMSLSHAVAVGILGALAIKLDRLLLPTETGPWLEMLFGLLIVGMGVALLRPRHEHRHDGDDPPPERIPVRRLAALGLVGGLIPSPEAIGIVLVAFSVGRWGTGMALILAFSLGLAAVVLAIALAAVRGAAILRRFAGGRLARIGPKVAAVVFLGMGVAVAVQGAARV